MEDQTQQVETETENVQPPWYKPEKEPTEDLFDATTKKNKKTIYCCACNSKVLLPNTGTLIEKDIFLHFDRKPKTAASHDGEILKWFWQLNSMMDFENIGFSRDIEGKQKYLTCADCELPIMGVQFLAEEEKNKFYLATSRVRYE